MAESKGSDGPSTDSSRDARDPAPDDVTEVRLLLVSDIHTAIKRVAALTGVVCADIAAGSGGAERDAAEDAGDGGGSTARPAREPPLDTRPTPISAVLCSGDIVDVPTSAQKDAEAVSTAEGELSSILAGLENIRCRVFYIPGNHDPVTAFNLKEDPPRLTAHSLNVHGRCVELAPGLTLAGWGGSVPGYRDGTKVWEPFPYEEEDMRRGLDALLKPDGAAGAGSGAEATASAGASASAAPRPRAGAAVPTSAARVVPPDTDVLLMTHTGPEHCATATDARDLSKAPISGGSSAIRDTLAEPVWQERLVANVHGHVHNSPGKAWVGGVPVVNPGSLRYGGNYAVLTMRRQPGGRWRVASTDFLTLP